MPDLRTFPIVAVMVACGFVFLYQQTDPQRIAYAHGAVPQRVATAGATLVEGDHPARALGRLVPLVTAIFLHGDIEHLLYNMLFLWIFGSLVAQQLGAAWALCAILLCGVAGNIAQVLLNLESAAPIIGASGAIMGLEGLYLGMALRWQLPEPDVWPLAHPIPPLQLAALGVLGFVFDVFALMNHQQDVAYGAHVGGFLAGLVVAVPVTMFLPQRRTR